MGYDAYLLINSLYSGNDAIDIQGASGRLYLDQDKRVHRDLAWAQFDSGEPVPLDADLAVRPDDPASNDTAADAPEEWRLQQLNP